MRESNAQMTNAAEPARKEGRTMNAEELAAFDKYEVEWKGLEEQLKRVNTLIEVEKDQHHRNQSQ